MKKWQIKDLGLKRTNKGFCLKRTNKGFGIKRTNKGFWAEKGQIYKKALKQSMKNDNGPMPNVSKGQRRILSEKNGETFKKERKSVCDKRDV